MKNNWPLQKDCDKFYGNPRGKNAASASSMWESSNLINIVPPFQMYYAGKPVKSIKIHKKCADSLRRVFEAIWVAAGKDQKVINEWGVSTFGGSYNYRLMRGLNQLSMHAYGCALDLDPARNGLSDKTPNFAKYPQVIKAFKDEGWVWGGDWDGDGLTTDERRCDGMHFQAARIK